MRKPWYLWDCWEWPFWKVLTLIVTGLVLAWVFSLALTWGLA